MNVKLDHLVIAAASLEEGVNYIRQQLGVEIPYGGEHRLMGTHNHLMRLGEQCFLEVIAVNPDAAQPARPRWYGLDDPFVRQSVSRQPRLVGWVVNTDDISAALSRSKFTFGEPELISRDNLNWYFCLPDDGRLLAGGLVPYLMKWNTDHHPAANMADPGCELHELEIYHPNADWLNAILESISADGLVNVAAASGGETAYMVARISTPHGPRELSTKL